MRRLPCPSTTHVVATVAGGRAASARTERSEQRDQVVGLHDRRPEHRGDARRRREAPRPPREVRATQSPGRRHRSRRRLCPDGTADVDSATVARVRATTPRPTSSSATVDSSAHRSSANRNRRWQRRQDRHQRHRDCAQHDEAVVAERAVSPLMGHHDGQFHVVELVDEALATPRCDRRRPAACRRTARRWAAPLDRPRRVIPIRIHSRRTRARRTAATPSSTIGRQPRATAERGRATRTHPDTSSTPHRTTARGSRTQRPARRSPAPPPP